ncbi:hypothetical protein N5W20_02645 [Candidatus Kirkpatrickella diaphorinae]|uniref:Uncharacterized protein n=1 Tax=Candidatus Kirkpatrickella diaphorinae TaxID=2984322 RepID=A0ABY6GM12_9PROT|nr:hypothetical protein [Candidatus Kirkpatrickella diaphorinae]UYH51781.1 hypothetical protein N5W20_02645 [Candidatus Kirkpatrickella diaphorinae]
MPAQIRTLLFCACLMLTATSAAQAGAFKLQDPRAPNEISETTRLYIDGRLAAVIHLHDGLDSYEKIIPVKDAPRAHHYALCGEMTVIDETGARVVHHVESEGILLRPDGHVIIAAADDDLGDFFLMDASEPGATRHKKGKAGICSGPIS